MPLLGRYFRVKASSKKNEKSGSHASAFYRTVQSTTSYQRYEPKKRAGERMRERSRRVELRGEEKVLTI